MQFPEGLAGIMDYLVEYAEVAAADEGADPTIARAVAVCMADRLHRIYADDVPASEIRDAIAQIDDILAHRRRDS